MLLQTFLGGVRQRFALIAQVDQFATSLVSRGILLRLLTHAGHFFLAQTARASDADFLLGAGGLVGGGNIQDSVGVNGKLNLNLRQATRR